ncbi:hypothetical protein CBS101457_006641 [Exobasidium rhododendri]|nr:hypothetical protein CBS101457_006641 [Exobasidium rhododendri]
MKKFFNRFSTTEKGGVNVLAKQQDEGALYEKVAVEGRVASKTEKVKSGEKVKALAARYETITGADSVRPDDQTSSPNRSSSHRFSSIQSKRGNKQRSPLLSMDKPLPAIDSSSNTTTLLMRTRENVLTEKEENPGHIDLSGSNHTAKLEDDFSNALQLPSTLRYTKEGRDASGASGSSFGSGGGGGQVSVPKTVAFAPSPKKPLRAASPPPIILMDPSDELLGGDLLQTQISSSSNNVGNFARATLASTARARNPTKHNSTDAALPSSSTSFPHQNQANAATPTSISRPNSSLSATRPPAKRSNSSSIPARRSISGWNGVTESGTPNISQPSLLASHSAPGNTMSSHATASRLSLTYGAGDAYSHLPNSIPFVSGGHLRSASPLSIVTTNSSIHNQIRNSMGSRRGSWTSKVNSNGSNSQGWASNGAKSIGGPSWSEMTQEDLVSNLGARERTRQEVLWEIVASEERYIKELERTKDLYLDALLRPVRFSPPQTPSVSDVANIRPRNSVSLENSGSGDLPIAARFMGADYGSEDATTSATTTSKRKKEVEVRSKGMSSSRQATVESNAVPAATSNAVSPQRISTTKTSTPKRWSNSRMGSTNGEPVSSQTGYGILQGSGLSVPLPSSLQITLEAIYSGLLEGHTLLFEALRKRYEEQWPLVRSLADVFAKYSYVLATYKDYVIHLERALDSLEEASLMERAMRGKRLKKEKLTMTVGLGRAVASLESAALERGECSLAIFLAMPFQRLLKYPLLFQNLLFHTDASTFEFESTVKMVVDVEVMIRSIEDEKADKEERDKTLDAFARIDGIKDKALLRPKRDRILVEETALYEENPRRAISESNNGSEAIEGGITNSPNKMDNMNSVNSANSTSSRTLRAALKSKRSYRRLSDFLSIEDRQNQSTKAPNMGSKRDIWILRFSDVELKCQRVGVTALPLVSSVILQEQQTSHRESGQYDAGTTGMTEEEIKIKEEFKRTKESRERMKILRNTTLRSKTRNLYKFIAVTSWKQSEKERGKEEEERYLDGLSTPHEVDEEEQEEDEDEEEDEEGGVDEDMDEKSSTASQETDGGVLDNERYIRQSKLSFSYWGHDKVEPKAVPVRTPSSSSSSSHQQQFHHRSTSVTAARSRESAAPLSPLHPAQKRHSLTSPGTLAMQSSSSPSTKAVASNFHAKAKVDKFGGRLRNSHSHTNDTSTSDGHRP